MSFRKVGYLPPTKPNFINSAQPVQAQMANNATVKAYTNNKSTYSMVVDKLARPVITAGIGLLYTYMIIQNPILNSYGLQKALIYGLSSVVADYLGNFLFEAAKIKKELGMFDIEDIVFEPVIGGLTFAVLNKYYMGAQNRFLMDFAVGTGANFTAGLVTVPLRLYI